MRKKKVLMLLVSTMVVLMVVSIALPTSAEKITITWWGKQMEALNIEIFTSVIPMFEAQYPNIKVEYIGLGDKIVEKTLSAVAAGTPPDMSDSWSAQIPTWAEAGAIQTTDEWMSDEDWDLIFPFLRDLCSYKGKAYGIPYATGMTGLYYNKLRFRQVGLDPQKPPTTIAELDEYGEMLTEVDEDGHLIKAGYLPGVPNTWCDSLAIPHAFGGKFYDEESGKITANDPNNVRAFEWMRSYVDKYGAKELQRFNAFVGLDERIVASGPVFTGDLAMWTDGSWQYAYGMRAAPEAEANIAVAPIPTLAGKKIRGVSVAWCDTFVVPTGSKHPREAMTFAKFFVDNETVILRWHARGNGFMESKRLWELPQYKEEWLSHWETYDRILKEDIYQIYPHPVIPEWQRYWDDLRSLVEAVRAGGTPKELLDDLTKEMQERLDEYR